MSTGNSTPYDVQHNGKWYYGVVNNGSESETIVIRVGTVERQLRIVNSQQPRHMSPRAWIEPEIREHILEMIRELDAQGELTEEHLSATYLEKLK